MSHPTARPPEPVTATAKDPVCGMSVTPGKAIGGSATHAGHEYWFCNPRCRDKFIADPATYLPAADAAPAAATVKAPVCGMTVPPGKAKGGSATHAGHEYWFCTPRCRDKLLANPATSLPGQHAPAPATPPAPAPPAPAPPTAGAIHTCPMHPEVRRPGPGDCPDCGMALEPEV